MSAAALGCGVQVDERQGRAADTEHEDPEHGDGSNPTWMPAVAAAMAKQGDHECHGDPVTDHLDGEGLGWRGGDGEIGDDDVGQPWDPGDVHLECSCGQISVRCRFVARCLTDRQGRGHFVCHSERPVQRAR